MKFLLIPIFALSLLAGCASMSCPKPGSSCCKMSDGTSASTVSESAARQAALAKVPGTVQKSEMETWKGKKYYTFDIATKDAKKPVEVAVDPQTGQVVWTSNEKER